ncbi:hypothetical protein PSCICO_47750 [Pseudomonas cichorii]|uniref:DUF1654 domain-containing protein n=1 Tax=Pseudomonas cichorii TaxID=36746 RepID=UPI0019106FC5|nr:DUF1654 domain-containing protein [Pseudomonas cichorii]GFM89376.1 hypothetical protein PSCICO_47750 [Pseudomonas cichorii]
MLSRPAFTTTKPRTYEHIRRRIQRILTDPKLQKTQSVTVARLPDESCSDWRNLMTEIGEVDGIRLDDMGDGVVRIAWKEYSEA